MISLSLHRTPGRHRAATPPRQQLPSRPGPLTEYLNAQAEGIPIGPRHEAWWAEFRREQAERHQQRA